MREITIKESKKYVPCVMKHNGEDFDKMRAEFYTSIKGKDGWDKIKYYTGDLIMVKGNQRGAYDSTVYILSTESMPGYCKIGFTDRTAAERAKEISRGTGVATPFKVEWEFFCYRGHSLEKEVHEELKNRRSLRNKEHFTISIEEAKDVITRLGNRYL